MNTDMSSRMRRAVACLAVVAVSLPVAASAREAGDTGSTSTSSTSSTTAPAGPAAVPSTTTTTASTTTTTAPPPPPPEEPPEEAPSSEPPPEAVEVPPPEDAQAIEDAELKRRVARQLGEAKAAAAATQLLVSGAEHKVATLEAAFAQLQDQVRALAAEQRRAVRRLERARVALQERATMAFIRGPARHLSVILESHGPNDFSRRMELIQSVLDADQDAVEEYREAKKALTRDLVRLALRLGEVRDALGDARLELLAVADEAGRVRSQVSALEAGASLASSGFAFPVGEPYSFVDTFGAPRMTGTEYEHLHEGTDVFAPAGTPLFALERGVLTRMGSDVLGGTKLWLVGMSGNRYYYAHLSAFAEGLSEGQLVDAGTVVGYVGDTGNAKGGAAHLHFEIHPPAGGPANPYPILKLLSDAARAAAAPSG